MKLPGQLADAASLAAEVERLRSTLDHVGAYVFTKDLDGRYTYANRMVCELFGVPLEQIVGQTDERFFDLATSSDLRLNDRRVLELGEQIEGEERNFLADTGELRIYWSVKLPLRTAAGGIIGMCGISTDITERRQVEDALQEQRILLNTVLDNVDAYVYMKDRDLRYLYVNPKTAELFGRTVEEVLGHSDAEMLPADVAEGFMKLDRQVFETGESARGEETFLDQHGMASHYWTVKIPLRRHDGIYALIGISTDVSRLHRIKEEFRLLANADALTGTMSRRHFLESAEAVFRQRREAGLPFAIAALDVDHFKQINDSHGHAAGDRVLQTISERCRGLLRPDDLFGRLGGDEMCIVMGTDRTTAQRVCMRLLGAISGTPALMLEGATVSVTASIGLAMLDAQTTSLENLLKQADEALYAAKRNGRNTMTIFGN